MGMILTGIVVAFAITIGAGAYLSAQPTISWQAFSTSSTYVGDPGHNLVGKNWTGDPSNDSSSDHAG